MKVLVASYGSAESAMRRVYLSDCQPPCGGIWQVIGMRDLAIKAGVVLKWAALILAKGDVDATKPLK